MKCPGCGNKMIPDKLPTVTIDRCSSCRGVWFDAGELVKYRRFVELGLESKSGAFLGYKSSSDGALMQCPQCEERSLEVGYITGNKKTAHCTKCFGYFVGEPVLIQMMEEAEEIYERQDTGQENPWWSSLIRLLGKRYLG